MSATILCKNCNADVEIPDGFAKVFVKCNSCQKMTPVNLPASVRAGGAPAPAPPRPAPAARPAPPPPPAQRPPPPVAAPPPSPRMAMSTPASSSTSDLPEIMKANKRIAGHFCTVCKNQIQLGEDVHNCPSCSQASHQTCWNRNHGCATITCAGTSSQSPSSSSMVPMEAPGAMAQSGANQVPCRWCKEPIIRGAKKCKHCGEFQSDGDRSRNQSGADYGVVDETDDWGRIILMTVLVVITMPFCIGPLFLLAQGLMILGVMLGDGCGTVLLGIFVPFYSQYYVWTNRHTRFENKTGPKVWVVCSALVVFIQLFLALAGVK